MQNGMREKTEKNGDLTLCSLFLFYIWNLNKIFLLLDWPLYAYPKIPSCTLHWGSQRFYIASVHLYGKLRFFLKLCYH